MNYETKLTGSNRNSLGNTIKVVKHVVIKKIELIHLKSFS